MNFSALILDIVVVLILITTVWISAKRGFLRSFLQAAGFFIAGFLAYLVYLPVSNFLYHTFFEGWALRLVRDNIGTMAVNFSTALGEAVAGFPGVGDLISSNLLSLEQSYGEGAEAFAQSVVEKVVGPVIQNILGTVVLVAIFVILLLVVGLVARALGLVKHIPLVGSLNTLLGGVFGVALGAVYVILLYLVLKLVIMLSSGSWGFLSESTLEDSFIIGKILMRFIGN